MRSPRLRAEDEGNKSRDWPRWMQALAAVLTGLAALLAALGSLLK